MTVTTTASRDVNNGNGATTAFPVSFKFFVAADLVVTHILADGTENLKVLTTDYTVTGDGPAATGVVTTTSFTAATGTQVVVERSILQTQAIDYTANDPFPAETNEEGLDRGVMLSQQLDDLIQRALTLPKNATESGITFPELSGETAKFLRVNAAEDAFEFVTPLTAGSITIPVAIAEGGTAATTVKAARDNLSALTTRGDVIRGDINGDEERLALGAANTVLQSNGTDAVFAKLAVATLANGIDGELITWDAAAAPATVGAGTSGQFLKSQGAGSVPLFDDVPGTWRLLEEQVASASAQLDLTVGIDSAQDDYMIVLDKLVPATNDTELNMRVSLDGGSTFRNTAGDYTYAIVYLDSAGTQTIQASGSDTEITTSLEAINAGVANDLDGVSGVIRFSSPDATGALGKDFLFNLVYCNDSTAVVLVSGAGRFDGSTAAVDALRFFFAAGNITSGSIRSYGLRK